MGRQRSCAGLWTWIIFIAILIGIFLFFSSPRALIHFLELKQRLEILTGSLHGLWRTLMVLRFSAKFTSSTTWASIILPTGEPSPKAAKATPRPLR